MRMKALLAVASMRVLTVVAYESWLGHTAKGEIRAWMDRQIASLDHTMARTDSEVR